MLSLAVLEEVIILVKIFTSNGREEISSLLCLVEMAYTKANKADSHDLNIMADQANEAISQRNIYKVNSATLNTMMVTVWERRESNSESIETK